MKHESANLDLLRTIAVSLVVLSHVGLNAGWGQQKVINVEAVGRVGVGIFFVHTALVLMQSLERRQDGPLAFFVRRAFRIYPLAIITVLLAVACSASRPDLSVVVSNLLLVQNVTGHPSAIGPLWSLPYEMQMYLVLPALYVVTTKARPVACIAAIWLVSLVVAASGLFPLLVYAPCFMAGVLAYTLIGRKRVLSPVVLFAAVAAAVLVVGVLEAAGFREEPLLWAMCAVLGLLLPFAREIKAGWLASVASVGAKYSYSIYLMHMFALMAGLRLYEGPFAVQMLLAAVVLAMYSRVTYRWIEQPGIELGKRMAQWLAHQRAGVERPQT